MKRNKSIIIRVDGNTKIGLGHIYRGIALAEMLKDDFEVRFITRQDSTVRPIIETGFNYDFLPVIKFIDEPEWFKKNIDNNSIIVCDGYEFKTGYQKKIKEYGFKLVYIDDLVEYHMYADLVINHAPGISEKNYNAEPYTKFALGTNYAILRPAFLKAAKQNRTIDKIDTAFVSFGGSDFYDITSKTVKALMQIPEIKRINVVVGSAYNHQTIFSLQESDVDKIRVYKNLPAKEILEIMEASNIAVVPASTILYEVSCVKIPVICGYYADNQKNIYNAFVNRCAVNGVGRWQEIDIRDLVNVIKKVIKSDLTKQISKKKSMFDGKSGKRLFRQINFLSLKMREVRLEDKDTLFRWVNDPDVRYNAINRKTIEYKEHSNWFDSFLKKEDSYIFIMLWDNNPVGQIRFDYDKDSSTYFIDYSIDKNYRGKGFGMEIIKRGMLLMQTQMEDPAFTAVVRNENKASYHIFESLGFVLKETYNNFSTFVFK